MAEDGKPRSFLWSPTVGKGASALFLLVLGWFLGQLKWAHMLIVRGAIAAVLGLFVVCSYVYAWRHPEPEVPALTPEDVKQLKELLPELPEPVQRAVGLTVGLGAGAGGASAFGGRVRIGFPGERADRAARRHSARCWACADPGSCASSFRRFTWRTSALAADSCGASARQPGRESAGRLRCACRGGRPRRAARAGTARARFPRLAKLAPKEEEKKQPEL